MRARTLTLTFGLAFSALKAQTEDGLHSQPKPLPIALNTCLLRGPWLGSAMNKLHPSERTTMLAVHNSTVAGEIIECNRCALAGGGADEA